MCKQIKYLIIILTLFIFSCQNNPKTNKYGLDNRTELALDYIASSGDAIMLSRKHSILSFFLRKRIDLMVVNDVFIEFNEDIFTNELVAAERIKNSNNTVSEKDLRSKWYKFFKKCKTFGERTLEHPIKEYESNNGELIVFRSKPCHNFYYFFLGDSTYTSIEWSNGRLYYMGSAMLYLFEFNDKDEIENVFKANVEFG